jgi:Fe-S cluster assembly ATP-binding protein
VNRPRSVLSISDLHAWVAGHSAAAPPGEILRGVDLEVRSGEVHALMGPNGSGKSTLSHVLMGRPGYRVTRGSVTIDGEELLGLPAWQRAQRGLFLTMQYPIEVPGVKVTDLVVAAARARGGDDDAVAAIPHRVRVEAERLGVREELLERGVNDEFSGGEQKRTETLQLAVSEPKFAVLDEIDSGLDVDALREVARRVEQMTNEQRLGVLAITHYARLLGELKADRVHIMMGGRIVRSGGAELADELEARGYEGIAADLGITEMAIEAPAEPDPFADPTIGATPFDADPFADPLAGQ